MSDFIRVYDGSLTKELCVEIIDKFADDDHKYGGVTAGGHEKSIKDSTDLQVRNDETWSRIRRCLMRELEFRIPEYISSVSATCWSEDHTLLKGKLCFDTLQIQKYRKGEGKYVCHTDQSCRTENGTNQMRAITYLWYLNNVEKGGETAVLSNIKIQPSAGRLLLFPATWTYPHCGMMPESGDKYIVTGWVYQADV
jgi:hypothetical protein